MTTSKKITDMRNDSTGELSPPHVIGTDANDRALYHAVPGWTPVDVDGNEVPCNADEDGNLTVVSCPTTATPLADALTAAIVAADLADRAWLEDDSCDADDKTHPAWLATEAADLARDAARAALAGSTELRAWTIAYLDSSGVEESIMATSTDDALRQAEDGVRGGDWGNGEDPSTTYVDVEVTCALSGVHERVTVVIHPDEPDCASSHSHDWRSPIELVGGCVENPGVVGHGGGVIVHEVCRWCGLHRRTDTDATRRDNGQQGMTEVSYQPADAETRAWVAESSK